MSDTETPATIVTMMHEGSTPQTPEQKIDNDRAGREIGPLLVKLGYIGYPCGHNHFTVHKPAPGEQVLTIGAKLLKFGTMAEVKAWLESRCEVLDSL